ncbi:Flavodoxin domain-containing protein [Lachnospiraceae bacterium NE2001]|nr:Flavodoxin domain-containing protein [Lachnospiraceae bacterium NE2001]
MNKERIIIYGSCYGTTKKYAEELSRRLYCKAVSYENVSDINSYHSIIYMGGLYAGGVQGMKKTLKKLSDISDKTVCIVTVGLADPKNEENINNIRMKMKTQVSEELFNKAKIFHLRGGIDYAELSFLHKKMMGMVYKKAKSVPEEERNAELSAMIETYNKQVDFVDYDSLAPIVQSL